MIDKTKQYVESKEGLSTRLTLQGSNDIDLQRSKKMSARPKFLFGGSLRNKRGAQENPGELRFLFDFVYSFLVSQVALNKFGDGK